jgi:hypothetical protein
VLYSADKLTHTSRLKSMELKKEESVHFNTVLVSMTYFLSAYGDECLTRLQYNAWLGNGETFKPRPICYAPEILCDSRTGD